MSETPPLRWGILGTAQINQKIIPLLKQSQVSTLSGISSRDADRAREYANKWEIPTAYAGYEALVNDPTIQVIYNSLPNHLHFEWSLKALQRGKHVLCEKPLTIESAQIPILQAEAIKNGVVLAEGLMYQHHAQTSEIIKIVAGLSLGKLKHIRAHFHSVLPLNDRIRLHPELGGGVHWDIGCYLVNLIQLIANETPKSILSWARKGENGEIEALSASLGFPSGVTSNLECSFYGPRKEGLDLVFEDGWMSVARPFKPTEKEEIQVVLNRNPRTITIEDPMSPYAREIADFEGAVLSGLQPRISLNESYRTIQTIERIALGAQYF
jgi:xylose dehydrogenase (NAD/NADP)